MRKTIATVTIALGVVLAGATAAAASDAPVGPAPVGQIVASNGGCYTDAERAAMTDAQLATVGANPDYCWGDSSVGQVVTGCEGDSCQPAAAPIARHARAKAHRKHHRARH